MTKTIGIFALLLGLVCAGAPHGVRGQVNQASLNKKDEVQDSENRPAAGTPEEQVRSSIESRDEFIADFAKGTSDTTSPESASPAYANYAAAEIQKAMASGGSRIGPVDSYYRLGPKDEIIINLTGATTQRFNPVVDDSGFVTFQMRSASPGTVSRDAAPAETKAFEVRFSVNGVYFKDLKRKVIQEISAYTENVDLFRPESGGILVDVTLGEIRGISVTIRGEVRNPGQKLFTATVSSVYNALAAAGGIKEPEGSYREIEIHHPSGKVDRIDLLALHFEGLQDGEDDSTSTTMAENFRLRDGDVLWVPIRQRTARIEGRIKRPGFYEIREGEPLLSLIEIAGGMEPDADPMKVKIRRIQNSREAVYMDVDLIGNPDFIALNGDQVEIIAKPEARRPNIVQIKGAGVRQPGSYEFRVGMSVRDLVERAGGLYGDAITVDVPFVRTNVDFSQQYLRINLGDMLSGAGREEPLLLKPLDTLIVNSKFYREGGEKFVYINGHVKEPGEWPYSTGMTLYDLIFMAGGFSDKDFLKETYLDHADIVRKEADGEINIPFHLGNLLASEGKSSDNQPLVSRDEVKIYSRREIEGSPTVEVLGHVKHPGSYRFRQNMRVSDLLFLGGGFNDPDFLRATYLERADIVRVDATTHLSRIVPVDLRKVIEGDAEANFALESRDCLRIYAFEQFQDKQTVHIGGEVRAAGVYELTDGMLLSDLIARANGLTERADAENIEIARYPKAGSAATQAAELLRVSAVGPSAQAILLRDRDRVEVRAKPELREKSTVVLTGEVRSPGAYVLESRTETISSLVRRAGGFLQGAAPEAASLVRKRSNALRRAPEASETIEPETGEATTHSVSLNLPAALEAPGGPYDLTLLDGDAIRVPKQDWTVSVRGEVLFPGAVQFVAGENPSYYLRYVGGYTEDARRSRTVVIYANGEVRRARRLLFFAAEIRPGCTIWAPPKSRPLAPGSALAPQDADELRQQPMHFPAAVLLPSAQAPEVQTPEVQTPEVRSETPASPQPETSSAMNGEADSTELPAPLEAPDQPEPASQAAPAPTGRERESSSYSLRAPEISTMDRRR